MIQLCALASGSNGNCYYIGNESEAVLIDMGISNRQLKKRMQETGLSLQKVKALFISHEHVDHIKGMRSVTDCNPIAGFATLKTYESARKDYRSGKISFFSPGDVITVGSMKIHTFSKKHDAADPVSFRIEIDNRHIAVLTDLGEMNETISAHLGKCEAAFLETNYDHNMLMTGNYPYYLKKRVASAYGHLGNHQALELVKSINDSPLRVIFLSHISAQNNRVELALEAFKDLEQSLRIIAPSGHEPTEVVEF